MNRLDQAELLQRGAFDVGRDRDAGIVDQHIELAKALDCDRDGIAPVIFAAHVMAHEDAIDLFCQRPAGLFVNVGDDDLGPFPGQQDGISLTQARSATRYQDYFSIDTLHGLSPYCC